MAKDQHKLSPALLMFAVALPLGVAMYAADRSSSVVHAYCTDCSAGYCKPDYSNVGGYYSCQDDGVGTFCDAWDYCPPLR